MQKSKSFSVSRPAVTRPSHRHGTVLEEPPQPKHPTTNPFQSMSTLNSSISLTNIIPPTPNHDKHGLDSAKNQMSRFATPKLQRVPTEQNTEVARIEDQAQMNNGLRRMNKAANGIIAMNKMNQLRDDSKDKDRTPLKGSRVLNGEGSLQVAQDILGKPKITNRMAVGAEKRDTSLPSEKVVAKPRYSYVRQRLLFYPKELDSITMANGYKASFNSFDELSKKTQTVNAEMFDNLLDQNLEMLKPTDGSVKNQLNVIKKVLKFNKMQKKHYVEHLNERGRKIADYCKTAETPYRRQTPVRVTPSKRFFISPFDMTEDEDVGNTTQNSGGNVLNRSDEVMEKHEENVMNNKSMITNILLANRITENAGIRFFWHFNNGERGQWKPAAREGHTLTTVGRNLVLYGGISNKLTDDILLYDITRDIWTIPQVKGDRPLQGRHSHSACEYQGRLVIFGGETEFNHILNVRQCLSDMYWFEPDKGEWSLIKPHNNSISSRRNHTAVIHDQMMYVFGGINSEGLLLNDFWRFNLRTHEWVHMDVAGDKEVGQAFHTMVACYEEKPTPLQMHNNHHPHHHPKPKAFEEGLYVFGGKNNEGKVIGTLKYLSLSDDDLEWKYPVVKGFAPAPRYNHIMVFNQQLKSILIHGGRNDHMSQLMNHTGLDDIRILNLEKMTWNTSAAVGNISPVGRARHAAALIGSTLAIFGGVGYTEYASPDMKLVETNQINVWKMNKEYEKQKREEELQKSLEASDRPTPVAATPVAGAQTPLNEQRSTQVSQEITRKDYIRLEPLLYSQHMSPSKFRNSMNPAAMNDLNRIEAERIRLRKSIL